MENRKLIARDGYFLTNHNQTMFATTLELGIGDDPSNYIELPIVNPEPTIKNNYEYISQLNNESK